MPYTQAILLPSSNSSQYVYGYTNRYSYSVLGQKYLKKHLSMIAHKTSRFSTCQRSLHTLIYQGDIPFGYRESQSGMLQAVNPTRPSIMTASICMNNGMPSTTMSAVKDRSWRRRCTSPLALIWTATRTYLACGSEKMKVPSSGQLYWTAWKSGCRGHFHRLHR